MVEVTGGRFWAPYRGRRRAAGGRRRRSPRSRASTRALFRKRPPIDLASPRLRALAAALGPAYVRVSGTWANSTYFHDSDDPAPTTPPAGLRRRAHAGAVAGRRRVLEGGEREARDLVRHQPRGARRPGGLDAGPGREARSPTPRRSAAASRRRSSSTSRTSPPMGGAPKGYDAAAYGRDFAVFLPFVRKAAPGLLVLGPGSVGEGGMLASFPGAQERGHADGHGAGPRRVLVPLLRRRLEAVRRRPGSAPARRRPRRRCREDWLSRTERDARFYVALRDRFEPGKPLWLTETGETACGGNPWASTFIDTFRYVEQLGRLAKLGVQVVMHNTLAASDYALIDEETLEPRPSYWAALLWRRLMGRTVLDAGPSPAPGVHLYAHCLAASRAAWRCWPSTPTATPLTSWPSRSARALHPLGPDLLGSRADLNGRELKLGRGDALPEIAGEPAHGRRAAAGSEPHVPRVCEGRQRQLPIARPPRGNASMSRPLPVTLVAAFLGAGKTTLLNRLLRRRVLAAGGRAPERARLRRHRRRARRGAGPGRDRRRLRLLRPEPRPRERRPRALEPGRPRLAPLRGLGPRRPCPWCGLSGGRTSPTACAWTR